MKVTKKDLRGDIDNFHIEIVQKMCENQVKQGNKFSPKIFQLNRYAEGSIGGFDWDKTDEGYDYWWDIIEEGRFYLFYENKNLSRINTARYYLVYYTTGNDWENWDNEIFVTDDPNIASEYVNKYNKILEKWYNIYIEYTCIEDGVRYIKKEYEDKYPRWSTLNNILGCNYRPIEFRFGYLKK